MHLSSDKLSRAFAIASELLSDLTRGDGSDGKPIISIEQLQDVVQSQTGVSITKKDAVFEAKYLRGRVERYDGGKSAIIHIRSNQELEWKRFVSAKEIIHIKIDGFEDFSPYGDQTLDELIRKGHFGQASIPELGGEPAQSEIIAEIAALEVLYPLDMRNTDLDALGERSTTRIRLAHKYGIPANYAATALDPVYLRHLLSQLNGAGDPP